MAFSVNFPLFDLKAGIQTVFQSKGLQYISQVSLHWKALVWN